MFDIAVDGEQISKPEFVQLTNSMQKGQYVRFKIKNYAGQSILEESYLKFEEEATIQSFLKDLLKTKIRQKKITKAEAKTIQKFLFLEETQQKDHVPEPNTWLKHKNVSYEKENKINEIKEKKKHFSRRQVSLSIIMLLFFLFSVVIVFRLSPHFRVDTNTLYDVEAVELAAFKEDLSSLTPKKIGEKYPEKLNEIETYYLEKKDFDSLQELNEYHPTKNSTFDLAFHQKDWEKIIVADVDDLTKERQVMLAHAFIQLNQLEEAELLNSRLNSELLIEELDQAYVKKGLSFLKQRKVADAVKLTDAIQHEDIEKFLRSYIDNATIIIDFIELYEEKNDEKNQHIWERKLQELGEDSRHE